MKLIVFFWFWCHAYRVKTYSLHCVYRCTNVHAIGENSTDNKSVYLIYEIHLNNYGFLKYPMDPVNTHVILGLDKM